MMRLTMIGLLLVGMAGTGCQALVSHYETLPAGVMNMEGHSVSFVPMGEGGRAPFSSSFGNDFAKRVSDQLKRQTIEQEVDVEVKEVAPVVARVNNGDIRADNWGLIGSFLKVDYLVIGYIRRNEVEGKPSRNGAIGRMEVEFHVYDVKNQVMALTQTVRHTYPKRPDRGMRMISMDMTQEDFRQAMHEYVAEHLAWNFYNREMLRTRVRDWQMSPQK